jgi:hypothetical protein
MMARITCGEQGQMSQPAVEKRGAALNSNFDFRASSRERL